MNEEKRIQKTGYRRKKYWNDGIMEYWKTGEEKQERQCGSVGRNVVRPGGWPY
jgi:hypothetical protein